MKNLPSIEIEQNPPDARVERQAGLERSALTNQIDEMAAGLAHELNQPLAALIYVLTGAANRARSGNLNNAQMLDALRTAIAHGHRAAGIVKNIREQVVKSRTKRTKVQLNQVVRDMAEFLAPTAESNRVMLRPDLDARMPQVMAEKLQIEQVLLNLIRNAIEAVVEADGQQREVVVRTTLLDEGAVEVGVEDTGTGLQRVQALRMFEPFYSTKGQGMGLGLSICQTIVGEHNGRIWAENRREGGTHVRFTLPTEWGR